MTEDQKLAFIPFHAINQFMRNDFRLTIIRSALLMLPNLSEDHQKRVNKHTRSQVRVPGFRNSTKAPVPVRAVATSKAFENSPKLVAAILSAWSEANPELRQQVYEFLVARGWKILPIEVDRAKLPGFLTRWPAEEEYEVLYDAFNQVHPESEASIDELSLMPVWLAGRLPVEKVSQEEIEALPLPEAVEEEAEEKF